MQFTLDTLRFEEDATAHGVLRIAQTLVQSIDRHSHARPRSRRSQEASLLVRGSGASDANHGASELGAGAEEGTSSLQHGGGGVASGGEWYVLFCAEVVVGLCSVMRAREGQQCNNNSNRSE